MFKNQMYIVISFFALLYLPIAAASTSDFGTHNLHDHCSLLLGGFHVSNESITAFEIPAEMASPRNRYYSDDRLQAILEENFLSKFKAMSAKSWIIKFVETTRKATRSEGQCQMNGECRHQSLILEGTSEGVTERLIVSLPAPLVKNDPNIYQKDETFTSATYPDLYILGQHFSDVAFVLTRTFGMTKNGQKPTSWTLALRGPAIVGANGEAVSLQINLVSGTLGRIERTSIYQYDNHVETEEWTEDWTGSTPVITLNGEIQN